MQLAEELLAIYREMPAKGPQGVTELFESLGIQDQDGLRAFCLHIGETIARRHTPKADDISAGIAAGFYVGLVYADRHKEAE